MASPEGAVGKLLDLLASQTAEAASAHARGFQIQKSGEGRRANDFTGP